ncbi:hypothetical protein Bbelb_419850 [Branchiostoma belcheri]|nr:hypothetical protein Bbelb_419850 [Branchiostoma belcheri]
MLHPTILSFTKDAEDAVFISSQFHSWQCVVTEIQYYCMPSGGKAGAFPLGAGVLRGCQVLQVRCEPELTPDVGLASSEALTYVDWATERCDQLEIDVLRRGHPASIIAEVRSPCAVTEDADCVRRGLSARRAAWWSVTGTATWERCAGRNFMAEGTT